MAKLPFIISIPHGGSKIPEELKPYCVLTEKDILEDSDTFTIPIYNLENSVEVVLIQPLAKAILDVNRQIEEMPPKFSDGVLKNKTVNNKPVYTFNNFLNNSLFEGVFKNYRDYHQKISDAALQRNIILGLDCHSMLPEAPVTNQSPDIKGPLFNLGNNHGQSCSYEITKLLAESITNIFNVSENEVLINKPFSGGYITRQHGNNPLPWIQIEINKSLYLKEPLFNRSTFYIESEPLNLIKDKMRQVFYLFYDKLIHIS